MKKFDSKIQKKYETLYAEARGSRWLGDYQNAEKLLLKCYKYYKGAKKRKQLIDILETLIDLYMESERFTEALSYVEELLDLFKIYGTNINFANTFNDLGRIYQNIGKRELASSNFNKSLKISKETNYKLGISVALTNLATQLRFEGRFEESLNLLLKAEKICEDEGYYGNLMAVLIALSAIYSDLGNLDKSEAYLLKGETNLSHVSSDARLVATFYAELAAHYQWSKNLDKSMEFHKKSLQISQAKDLKLTTALTLINLGILTIHMRDFDNSYKYLIQGLQISREFNNKMYISRALSSLGMLFIKQNNFPKATKYLEDSQNIVSTTNNFMARARNYGLLGDCYDKQNNYHESYRNYTQCLFNYQKLLNNIHTISLRKSFRTKFENLIEIIHKLNKLLESGKIDPDVSKLIETKDATINTCKKLKELYPHLPNEDLRQEIKKLTSIVNELKGPRLESDARKMLRRAVGYNIEDSGKNWMIKERELVRLVEGKCYKDYSNKSIEIDIYGSKRDNNRIIYVLGECKYRNRPINLLEIKCFIIKSNLIAKNYLNQNNQKSKYDKIFHLLIISINGFPDENEIDNILGEYWDLPNNQILNEKLEIINKELFLRSLKKNKISAGMYEKI